MLPEPLQHFGPPSAELSALLNEIDAAKVLYAQRPVAQRARTHDVLRLELTYHSNALEGNTLSLRETQMVIEGRTPPGEKDLREIYEARNHERSLRLIEKWLAQGSAFPTSEEQLLAIHATLMTDILKTGAGVFRDFRVRISGTGFIPPGSHRFPELMPALFFLANSDTTHPVLRAAELHYNLAAIHPFEDGNGRTARLMMNLDLLRSGYPLAVIRREQRGEYLGALDEANHSRWHPFATLIARCVLKSLNEF